MCLVNQLTRDSDLALDSLVVKFVIFVRISVHLQDELELRQQHDRLTIRGAITADSAGRFGTVHDDDRRPIQRSAHTPVDLVVVGGLHQHFVLGAKTLAQLAAEILDHVVDDFVHGAASNSY